MDVHACVCECVCECVRIVPETSFPCFAIPFLSTLEADCLRVLCLELLSNARVYCALSLLTIAIMCMGEGVQCTAIHMLSSMV